MLPPLTLSPPPMIVMPPGAVWPAIVMLEEAFWIEPAERGSWES